MKRTWVIISILVVATGLMRSGVGRAATRDIMISEVLTGDTSSQSKEFIELFNASDQPMSLANWTIEYKSASGKTWSKRVTGAADTELAAHAYTVFATEDIGAQHLTSGMAQTGGNIRIRDGAGNVVDQFAWGDGDSAEGSASLVAALGQSMARNLDEATDLLIDTDNNSTDFHLSMSLTPGSSPANEVEPVTDDTTDGTGGTADGGRATAADISITELLPDPQTPLSDSTDEFIELYNSGESPVQLAGWSLRDKSAHIYKLAPHELGPHEFYVLKSASTKISLNNDGDEISLLNPAGQVIDTSANYGSAKPGMSWGISDGGWAWLTEPTPGYSNAAPLSAEAEAASTKKTATSKKTSAKTSSTKAKAAKKPSKLASAAKAATPFTNAITDPVQNTKLWSWLLIGLGAGTIGYGIYAYRPEITHFIHQLRTKFRAR